AEVHQALDVHGHFAAEVALDSEFRDLGTDRVHLGLGEILHFRVGIHARALASSPRACPTDAIDVRQPDPHVLVHRYVDAGYTCHMSLTPAAACAADPTYR